jgi:hypothetical protein
LEPLLPPATALSRLPGRPAAVGAPVRGAPAVPSSRTSVGIGRSPPHTVAAPSSPSRPPYNRAPPPPGDGLRRRLGTSSRTPGGRRPEDALAVSSTPRAPLPTGTRFATPGARFARREPDSSPSELDPRCRPPSPRIEPCVASSAMPPLRERRRARAGRGGIHSAARSVGEGSTAPLDQLGRGELELEMWEMEAAQGWEASGMAERDGQGRRGGTGG